MRYNRIPGNIDEYVTEHPEHIRRMLEELRATIKKAAPDAQEKISYRMPAFTLKGMLVYFAAHTNHIGFYPFTSAIKAFSSELTPYHTSKGSVQFPFDKPLPVKLITLIVKFRAAENLVKAELKAKKKN